MPKNNIRSQYHEFSSAVKKILACGENNISIFRAPVFVTGQKHRSGLRVASKTPDIQLSQERNHV
jgi:hypothetical protein